MEKVLHLILHKKWFDEILSGRKKKEYRKRKEYWRKRLFTKEGAPKVWNFIVFRNGYSKNAREMKVEFRGITTGEDYEINLGKIIETKNLEK